MKCLLWETSNAPWGVGVAEFDGDKSTLLSHFEDDGARTLARQLIQSVDQVLVDAKCDLSNVDALAVSLGPGSWTGLRIGLTAAKTMAQSLKLPIIGVATFDIFAQALQHYSCHSEGALATEGSPEVSMDSVLIVGDPSTLLVPRSAQDDDARGQKPHLMLVQSPCRPGELYAKLWHCHGAERDLLETEWIGSYAQINSRLEFWINDLSVSNVVTNAPEQKIAATFRQAVTMQLEYRESTFTQRLQALGNLAAAKMHNDQADEVLQIQPIYLAPSAAEREYNAKHNKNDRYTIRSATLADLDSLIHLEEEVFMDSWSRDSLSSLFDGERNVVLVACQDDSVVGYITGWHVHEEAEIARLGVLHEARKQGIASALITAMVKDLEDLKVEKISLEVRVSNKAGFAVYHKFGFAARGRRPRYYEDGEDALVMVKGEV